MKVYCITQVLTLELTVLPLLLRQGRSTFLIFISDKNKRKCLWSPVKYIFKVKSFQATYVCSQQQYINEKTEVDGSSG